MKYPAGEIIRNGVHTPIFVDDFGVWTAEVGPDTVRKQSREDLDKEIAKLTKRAVVKVSVPFMRVTFASWSDENKVSFRRGNATGVHSGNGNLLVEWPPRRGSDSPVREQLTHLSNAERIFSPLTAGELEKYGELSRALREAKLAHENFLKIHELKLSGLKDAVLKTIDQTEVKDSAEGA